jgi:glutamate-1-semialdehyde 2,1-aminomutase
LELVCAPGFFEKLSETTGELVDGILEKAGAAGIPMAASRLGGMFGLFFTDVNPVMRYEQVTACDVERFEAFYRGMLERGVYLAPSAFEAGFVSSAHNREDIAVTVEAAGQALNLL